MNNYIPFLISLMIIAAVLQEHSVLAVVYLLAAVYFAGAWWSHRAMDNVTFNREFESRVFLDQDVPVQLEISNKGWLPVVWLQFHESLPIELISPNYYHNTVSLGSHHQSLFQYNLRAHKRGYYKVGPLFLQSGDLVGITRQEQREGPADYLTVYPKIVPLPKLSLPSRSPFGTLRHNSPIYEDPSRTLGKRDYQPGDSLRRIDWKSSATSGRLQVRLFEPSIALETCIFLDMDANDYDSRGRFDATELAITLAASAANWAAARKQSVGLYTNGLDGLVDLQSPQPIPARKGTGHLMSILDILARIQAGSTSPYLDLLRHALGHLTWGSTLMMITGSHGEALFDQIFQAQRMGLTAVLFLVGPVAGMEEAKQRASQFGVQLYHVRSVLDLESLT